MKLCKDCVHAERRTDGTLAMMPLCLYKPTRIDLVTGHLRGEGCELEREATLPHRCGADGRNWTAREKLV